MPFEPRRITDPKILRAMSHPVRVALLELLAVDGPMTATEAGARLGESPANASFHLRTLAKYGFVEEAEGGTGRQRPWRIVAQSTQLRGWELGPAGRIAAQALVDLMRQREIDQERAWQDSKERYPLSWRDAAGESHSLVFMTAGELAEFNREVHELLDRFTHRSDPQRRPADSLPVSLLLRTFPTRLPADEPPDGPATTP